MILEDPHLKEVIHKTVGDIGWQQLNKANVMFSCILNRTHGKLYMINKIKGQTPKFPLDWDLYSILKAHARILMTSGEIVKSEVEYQLFKDHKVFEANQSLMNYFKQRNPIIQKLFILSRQTEDQTVKEFVNPTAYQPIVIKDYNPTTEFRTIGKQDTINGYINQLLSIASPILIQSGVSTFQKYLISTEDNLIDFLLITEFVGEIPENCRGKEMSAHMITHFKLLYTSPEVKHLDGALIFNVYGPMDK